MHECTLAKHSLAVNKKLYTRHACTDTTRESCGSCRQTSLKTTYFQTFGVGGIQPVLLVFHSIKVKQMPCMHACKQGADHLMAPGTFSFGRVQRVGPRWREQSAREGNSPRSPSYGIITPQQKCFGWWTCVRITWYVRALGARNPWLPLSFFPCTYMHTYEKTHDPPAAQQRKLGAWSRSLMRRPTQPRSTIHPLTEHSLRPRKHARERDKLRTKRVCTPPKPPSSTRNTATPKMRAHGPSTMYLETFAEEFMTG